MIKPIIFIGPSLAIEKAERIFNADYRPPAKKGDFLRLMSSINDDDHAIVGLVDGLFLISSEEEHARFGRGESWGIESSGTGKVWYDRNWEDI